MYLRTPGEIRRWLTLANLNEHLQTEYATEPGHCSGVAHDRYRCPLAYAISSNTPYLARVGDFTIELLTARECRPVASRLMADELRAFVQLVNNQELRL